MARGGKQPGAGRPKKNIPTKQMRVPTALEPLISELCKAYKGEHEPHSHDLVMHLLDTLCGGGNGRMIDYSISGTVGKSDSGRRYLKDKMSKIWDRDWGGEDDYQKNEQESAPIRQMLTDVYGERF